YAIVNEGKVKINGKFKELSTLDFSSIDGFFDSYLEKAQGSVTALYNRYEADIVHRCEDIPWALLELLDTMEVPDIMKDRLRSLPFDLPPIVLEKPSIDTWAKREIRKSEKEVFERYDYW
ncbi:hypothetical protein LCGC14_3131810, partial [marine sediment metagenome]